MSPDHDEELNINDFLKQGGINLDEMDAQFDEEEKDKELER